MSIDQPFLSRRKRIFENVKIIAGVQPGDSKMEETGGKDESKKDDFTGRALS
jgi:hypothetical protein